MRIVKKTIKKAQLGGLVRKAAKTAVEAAPKKIVIPEGLKRSLAKSQRGPTKITSFSSEAERIAAGKPTNLQKAKAGKPHTPAKNAKASAPPKRDAHGFDIPKEKSGGKVNAKKK